MNKKAAKYLILSLLLAFTLANIIAALQAWHFTHFEESASQRTSGPEKITGWEKIRTLFLGTSLPHPENKTLPEHTYKSITLEGSPTLKAWLIEADQPKGTVLLCHGYGGEKSGMLPNAGVFLEMGYSCLLLDFAGAGESSGDQCTIGYKEADQVKRAYDYLRSYAQLPVILYGSSMGAAAIMRAQSVYQMQAQALILECPYSTMLTTTKARFKMMGLPGFPMANLLVFWGGTLNGFNAFDLEPVEYAKKIKTPVLLMHGSLDPKVSEEETGKIFTNLAGPKKLYAFPFADHENYVLRFKKEWTQAVSIFLTEHRRGE